MLASTCGEGQTHTMHVLANSSRSRYVAAATQPVRRLQIRPIVHNYGAFPTHHSPELHPGPCNSEGVWPRTDRHTDARGHNTFRVVYDTRNVIMDAMCLTPLRPQRYDLSSTNIVWRCYISRESETTRNVYMAMAVCVSVCLSVPRRIPTLLHGPGCNLGNGMGVQSNCALLGGFAIGARVSLLRQHRVEREMLARACTRSIYATLC